MDGAIDIEVAGKVVFVFLALQCLGPILFPIPIAIIRGRGFGILKTSREETYEGNEANNLWIAFAARFEYEGFKIDEKGFPLQLTAHRADQTNTSNDPTRSFGHAKRPLLATVTFTPGASSIRMNLVLQYKEFTVIDTGEGKYLEAMADRLVSADLAQVQRPTVLNPSYHINFAYYGSLALLMGAPLMLLPLIDASLTLGMFLGYGISLPVLCGLSLFGLVSVVRHPDEMSGKEKVPRVFAFALLAVALAFAIGWTRHGDAITVHFKNEIEKNKSQRVQRADPRGFPF